MSGHCCILVDSAIKSVLFKYEKNLLLFKLLNIWNVGKNTESMLKYLSLKLGPSTYLLYGLEQVTELGKSKHLLENYEP